MGVERGAGVLRRPGGRRVRLREFEAEKVFLREFEAEKVFLRKFEAEQFFLRKSEAGKVLCLCRRCCPDIVEPLRARLADPLRILMKCCGWHGNETSKTARDANGSNETEQSSSESQRSRVLTNEGTCTGA